MIKSNAKIQHLYDKIDKHQTELNKINIDRMNQLITSNNHLENFVSVLQQQILHIQGVSNENAANIKANTDNLTKQEQEIEDIPRIRHVTIDKPPETPTTTTLPSTDHSDDIKQLKDGMDKSYKRVEVYHSAWVNADLKTAERLKLYNTLIDQSRILSGNNANDIMAFK